jgi:hypothetical protein
MRTSVPLALALAAAGCSGAPGFMPPPVGADEMQVLSPLIKDIPSGADVTYCSYLTTKLADSIDVIGFHGLQAPGGHHALLYAAPSPKPDGTHVCTEDDMIGVTYVAGVGADKALNAFETLPEGLAFRVPAGAQLMIQTHWVNATMHAIDGQAAINLRTAPASAGRTPTDLISFVDTTFDIPAGQVGTHVTTCPVGADTTLFLLSGHEHWRGTHFKAEHIAGTGGATDILFEKDWQPGYEFDPPMNLYDKTTPLTLHAGDQVRVTCSWDNTAGTKDLTFPSDMCVAWGFYFPGRGEIDCVDGFWPQH